MVALRVPNRITEIIGMARSVTRFTIISSREPTYSVKRSDYAFWDKTRRGKSQGLEIGGLFIKPVTNKISEWSFNEIPRIDTNSITTDKKINEWLSDNIGQIVLAYKEALQLGDSFIYVNPDSSLTVLSPDTVRPIVDERDYSKILGWSVTNVFENPNTPFDVMTIEESFTAKERTRKISFSSPVKNRANTRTLGLQVRRQYTKHFPNLTGKIPVVHVSNMTSASEGFGRPELEALLNLLYKYDEVIVAAVHGNKKQGRATPVISGLGDAKNLEKFYQKYGKTRQKTLEDGTVETEHYLEFDSDKFITLGGDAKFSWESPGSFASDVQAILGLLFYIIVQHAEIPEYAMGTAVDTSKGSVSAQVDPLSKFIDHKRLEIQKWFTEVLDIAIRTIAVFEPATKIPDTIRIHWANLTKEEGTLILKAIQWAYSNGMLDDVEALSHTPIDVIDARKSVAKARKDFENRVGKTSSKMGTSEKQSPQDPELDKQVPPNERSSSQK